MRPISRAKDASDLLAHADIALYAAKAAGRNKARIFGLDFRAELGDRVSIDSQLDLFYDPAVPVALMAA